MMEALADQPATPFRVPEGIRLVRINAQTGALARRGDKVILEAFKTSTGNKRKRTVLDGSDSGFSSVSTGKSKKSIRSGTGGLY